MISDLRAARERVAVIERLAPERQATLLAAPGSMRHPMPSAISRITVKRRRPLWLSRSSHPNSKRRSSQRTVPCGRDLHRVGSKGIDEEILGICKASLYKGRCHYTSQVPELLLFC